MVPGAVCQTVGPILNPKKAFDSPGFELYEYVANLYLSVTDDVTDRTKPQIFYYPSLLASPSKVAVSD